MWFNRVKSEGDFGFFLIKSEGLGLVFCFLIEKMLSNIVKKYAPELDSESETGTWFWEPTKIKKSYRRKGLDHDFRR